MIELFLESRIDVDEFVGCSELQIGEIETAAGFPLPEAYKDFLRICGRHADGFFSHTSLCYPQVLRGNEAVKRMHADIFASTPTPFVFINDTHAATFSCFLASETGPDPPVFGLPYENGRLMGYLKAQHPSFTDWVQHQLRYLYRPRNK